MAPTVVASANLDADQRQVVEAPIPSVLIVEAAPGSGKTRTLTHRVAYLVSQGVEPSTILCVTFTNQAAEEMRTRLVDLVGEPAAKQMAIGTLHAIAAQILREMVGLRFAIYDETDQIRLAAQAMAGLTLLDDLDPARLVEIIARSKANLQGPRDLERRSQYLAAAFRRYEQLLAQAGALDFEDLIGVLIDYLEEPSLQERLHQRFRHVLVDEVQDLSRSQLELVIRLVVPEAPSLFVVGDPRQSIYGWRSALPQAVQELARRLPGSQVLSLPTNYRSTGAIVEAARQLFTPPVVMRTPRPRGVAVRHIQFGSDTQEAAFIASYVRSLQEQGRLPGEVAVLVRTRNLVPAIEHTFIEQAVPYTIVGGTSLLGHADVKGVLAYARLALNDRDLVAWARAMSFPARGIGEASQRKVVDRLASGESLADVLANPPPRLPQVAKEELAKLDRLIAQLRSHLHEPCHAFLVKLLHRLKLVGPKGRQVLLEDGVSRIAQLVEVTRRFGQQWPEATIADFLEYAHFLALEDPPSLDRTVIATIHAAKGREWPVVFVCGVDEGVLPIARNGEDREEERRVLYVAMTRAQDELILTSSRKRRGQHQKLLSVSSFIRPLIRQGIIHTYRPGLDQGHP